jgi:DNA-binding MarR family transcriptional regulator
MRLLAATENGLGVMEVARQLGINAAAVTRQVKELERDHLAQRRSDPKDGRRSFVRLSARGRKLFEGIHERSHALERALEKVIRPEEMSSAIAVLQKLRWFLLSVRCSHSTAVAGDWTLELSGLSAELTGENGNENA